MIEDKLLLLKVKKGNAEAFQRVYEKYESYLTTLAANLVSDINIAEDIVQEVFTGFVVSLEKFKLTGSLKGYLATCVVNRSRDYLRKIQRDNVLSLTNTTETKSFIENPDQRVSNNEVVEIIRRAMKDLPCDQREAIVLHLHGDMSFAQIGKLQNIPRKTAQSRFHYGLKKLRSILDGEVVK